MANSSDPRVQKRPPFNPEAKIVFTEAPDPSWRPGDGLPVGDSATAKAWKEDEKQGSIILRPDDDTASHYYRILKSIVVPRPVAFVSSISKEGIPNLAPFSFFNLISNTPPVIVFSASPKVATEKDTVQNIRHNKQFTVNIISTPWAKAANFAAMDMPAHVSEWTASGLTMMNSTLVEPAWVRESACAMECEIFQTVEIPSTDESTSHMNNLVIFGFIKAVHVRKAVLNERGTIDPTLLKPLARLGGVTYGTLGQVFDLFTPTWKDFEEEILALEVKAKGKEQ